MNAKKKTVSKPSFFKNLSSNLNFLRILSVVIAVICWLLVVTVIDEDSVVVVSDIPVEIDLSDTTAQQYGLSLIEGSGQEVSVRIQGRRVDIGTLTADDFSAYAVLSDVNKTGEYDLKVEVRKKSTGASYSIIKTTPATITASFDYLSEASFDVTGVAENLIPADGYIKDTIVVEPEQIELVGPQSQISKIAACVAQTEEKDTLTSTASVDAALKFYDSSGNLLDLPDVDYRNQEFRVIVPIYKQKTVPLKLNFVNVPVGVDASKLMYDLSTDQITIAGQEKLINSIESVSLSEIDFRKVDVGSKFRCNVNLSAGLINLDYLETVTVSFNDPSFGSTTVDISNIIISNTSSLYDVELVTTRLSNVEIIGNKAVLAGLTGADFVAHVDLANSALSQGSIRVYVTIHALDDSLFAWAVGEYAVTLNVTAKS